MNILKGLEALHKCTNGLNFCDMNHLPGLIHRCRNFAMAQNLEKLLDEIKVAMSKFTKNSEQRSPNYDISKLFDSERITHGENYDSRSERHLRCVGREKRNTSRPATNARGKN